MTKIHLHRDRQTRMKIESIWRVLNCQKCIKIFWRMPINMRYRKLGVAGFGQYKNVDISIVYGRTMANPAVGVPSDGLLVHFSGSGYQWPNSLNPIVQACYKWAEHGGYGGLTLEDYLVKMFG